MCKMQYETYPGRLHMRIMELEIVIQEFEESVKGQKKRNLKIQYICVLAHTHTHTLMSYQMYTCASNLYVCIATILSDGPILRSRGRCYLRYVGLVLALHIFQGIVCQRQMEERMYGQMIGIRCTGKDIYRSMDI